MTLKLYVRSVQVINFTYIVQIKFAFFLLNRDCPSDCPSCERPLHSPTKLPCQHFLCEKCAQELHLCHGCGMAVPDGYTYDPATDDIE